jgi:exodeoxyribonuclease VII large subunit
MHVTNDFQAENAPQISVSALLARAKLSLESQFVGLWVEGEVANFRPAPSGHWYFTLKDANAELKMAMFRGRNVYAAIYPSNGMRIRARGRVTIFEARGELQMVAETIEESGAGFISQAFEKLKAKLQAEGLFDANRKRKLNRIPRSIAVISSPAGAAIHDFLTVLQRRFPLLEVDIWPSLVQGDQAPEQICAAIHAANQIPDRYDALVITRGGGSALDLNCFNDESVVRAIAASQILTVSAIGHETDQSLCDFAADLRAATPTAAAEILTPDRAALTQQLLSKQRLLTQLIARSLQPKSQRLDYARRLLEAHSPAQRLTLQFDRLHRARSSLQMVVQRRLQVQFLNLQQLQARLEKQHPMIHVGPRALQAIELRHENLARLLKRLAQTINAKLEKNAAQLTAKHDGLAALNPARTLARGYAIVKRNNQVISTIQDLRKQETLALQFSDGTVQTLITDIHSNSNSSK